MSRPDAGLASSWCRASAAVGRLLAVAACLAPGCGRRLGVEVTGAVQRPGGQAVTGGEVMIEPSDAATPPAVTGRTEIRDGRYRFAREHGVQPGAYVVRVIPGTVLPGLGDQTGGSLFTPASRRVTVSAVAADNVFDFTVEPLATFQP